MTGDWEVVEVIEINPVVVSISLHCLGYSSEPSAQFLIPLHFKSPSMQAP